MAKNKDSKDFESSTGKDNPRGGDQDLNTPESSDTPVQPPSVRRPFNPSDEIHKQIEASDAKTKRPGTEFENMTDVEIKNYAVKKGIDGNDGLSRDEIIDKIKAFDGKRMFDDPAQGEYADTPEQQDRQRQEAVDRASQEAGEDVRKA